jgi:hypothetical protein
MRFLGAEETVKECFKSFVASESIQGTVKMLVGYVSQTLSRTHRL